MDIASVKYALHLIKNKNDFLYIKSMT